MEPLKFIVGFIGMMFIIVPWGLWMAYNSAWPAIRNGKFSDFTMGNLWFGIAIVVGAIIGAKLLNIFSDWGVGD
jgi:hypothetical protein